MSMRNWKHAPEPTRLLSSPTGGCHKGRMWKPSGGCWEVTDYPPPRQVTWQPDALASDRTSPETEQDGVPVWALGADDSCPSAGSPMHYASPARGREPPSPVTTPVGALVNSHLQCSGQSAAGSPMHHRLHTPPPSAPRPLPSALQEASTRAATTADVGSNCSQQHAPASSAASAAASSHPHAAGAARRSRSHQSTGFGLPSRVAALEAGYAALSSQLLDGEAAGRCADAGQHLSDGGRRGDGRRRSSQQTAGDRQPPQPFDGGRQRVADPAPPAPDSRRRSADRAVRRSSSAQDVDRRRPETASQAGSVRGLADADPQQQQPSQSPAALAPRAVGITAGESSDHPSSRLRARYSPPRPTPAPALSAPTYPASSSRPPTECSVDSAECAERYRESVARCEERERRAAQAAREVEKELLSLLSNTLQRQAPTQDVDALRVELVDARKSEGLAKGAAELAERLLRESQSAEHSYRVRTEQAERCLSDLRMQLQHTTDQLSSVQREAELQKDGDRERIRSARAELSAVEERAAAESDTLRAELRAASELLERTPELEQVCAERGAFEKELRRLHAERAASVAASAVECVHRVVQTDPVSGSSGGWAVALTAEYQAVCEELRKSEAARISAENRLSELQEQRRSAVSPQEADATREAGREFEAAQAAELEAAIRELRKEFEAAQSAEVESAISALREQLNAEKASAIDAAVSELQGRSSAEQAAAVADALSAAESRREADVDEAVSAARADMDKELSVLRADILREKRAEVERVREEERQRCEREVDRAVRGVRAELRAECEAGADSRVVAEIDRATRAVRAELEAEHSRRMSAETCALADRLAAERDGAVRAATEELATKHAAAAERAAREAAAAAERDAEARSRAEAGRAEAAAAAAAAGPTPGACRQCGYVHVPAAAACTGRQCRHVHVPASATAGCQCCHVHIPAAPTSSGRSPGAPRVMDGAGSCRSAAARPAAAALPGERSGVGGGGEALAEHR
eukprot:TRINITY_DN15522_c0_g1_i2.p1 TRINITY_DN15522_c0_g1~~TRINITY_DN15522_c0_g1_i2.p1  ORF type:complete len:996 (+),score=273.61 TRINITY_DN15522_c0_g1_i2:189-3176(+)